MSNKTHKYKKYYMIENKKNRKLLEEYRQTHMLIHQQDYFH
ncbi:hypothetical protein [Diplocloster agilis]|nr:MULTISPECIES: hypothetical protein [Lachnospiraceae]MCU6733343.1 hypothetical protein [Suonthocola fibrivorans]